jgi:hypothetical protein
MNFLFNVNKYIILSSVLKCESYNLRCLTARRVAMSKQMIDHVSDVLVEERVKTCKDIYTFMKSKDVDDDVLSLIKEFENLIIHPQKSEVKTEVKTEEVKPKKNYNNETYGISAEVAVCDVYGLKKSPSYEGRYNKKLVDKLVPVIKNFMEQNPDVIITESCGHNGGKADFIATIGSEKGQTLSLKTLMSNDGKIAPQNIGQKARNAWDKHFKTGFEGNKQKDKERFDFIKENIADYLKQMLDNLYCCQYFILIVDCKKTPKIILCSSKPKIDFKNYDVSYSQDEYKCSWDAVNLRYKGFSTSVKMIYNEKEISIGEIQFHNTRNCIKFRFYSKFLNTIQ